jgi:hypothetical protein
MASVCLTNACRAWARCLRNTRCVGNVSCQIKRCFRCGFLCVCSGRNETAVVLGPDAASLEYLVADVSRQSTGLSFKHPYVILLERVGV